MILGTLIITKEEAINHKYDIRKVYLINLKGYESFRFLEYTKALEFLKEIPEIKEVLKWTLTHN